MQTHRILTAFCLYLLSYSAISAELVPRFVESSLSEWSLISRKTELHNIVLQIKPSDSGGSSGFLSIADLSDSAIHPDDHFPVPDRTESYSTTRLAENGSVASTLVFISEQNIGVLSAFYRDTLTGHGWAVSKDSRIEESQVLLFNKGIDRIDIVLQEIDNNKIAIFANQVNFE